LGNYTERCHIKCEMKAPRIDPAVRELAVLSALGALGCGLAAAQGDFWFVAVFSATSVVTIIEAIRRLR
jgi:alkanesulfonate monooxygenase SsuD/methylene tetrahydromethanopterin reductase-like flavin-dependent oxidoreductase (luciferase family)